MSAGVMYRIRRLSIAGRAARRELRGSRDGVSRLLAEWHGEALGHAGDVLVSDTREAERLLDRAAARPGRWQCVAIDCRLDDVELAARVER